MNLAAHLPALQVVVPMMTAPLLVLLRVRPLPWIAAFAASVLAFAMAIELCAQVRMHGALAYHMGSWPPPYGIELSIDAFGALLLLIVTGASTVALLAGRQVIERDVEPVRQPLFYAAWLLTLAGLCGIVATGDAFNVFVFMEIASLATYVLVAAGTDRRALPAVFKYLVMGTIGATFFLIGVGLIYMMTGTLNLADMESRLGAVVDLKPILVAAGVITIGLALKAAVFPLHVWLPNAYAYAPDPVTAFIAASSTKVALLVLLRLDFLVFQGNLFEHDLQFAGFVMPLALLGVFVGSIVALFERNLKRLLAFSSIAQIGYILLGASFVSVTGLTAGIVHMFNHALAKGALFLAVLCLGYRLAGTHLDDLAGAARRMPWTMAAFVIGGLSLVGIPGTAGFVSKWYLLVAALETGPYGWLLAFAVVISSLLAALYLWRVVARAYERAPAGETATELAEAPLAMLLPAWAVALANIYYGMAPALPLELASRAAASLLGHVPP